MWKFLNKRNNSPQRIHERKVYTYFIFYNFSGKKGCNDWHLSLQHTVSSASLKGLFLSFWVNILTYYSHQGLPILISSHIKRPECVSFIHSFFLSFLSNFPELWLAKTPVSGGFCTLSAFYHSTVKGRVHKKLTWASSLQ